MAEIQKILLWCIHMLCTLFSNLAKFLEIAIIPTRCIDAFFHAKSDTKIDFTEEFIVLGYLSKDKQ